MGKLHTLRRAIERDPDSWRGWLGAARWKGGWYPSYGESYRAFVRKVFTELRGVGNADIEPR